LVFHTDSLRNRRARPSRLFISSITARSQFHNTSPVGRPSQKMQLFPKALTSSGLRSVLSPLACSLRLGPLREPNGTALKNLPRFCFERTQVMHRILLSAVAVAAFTFGGLTLGSAEAHGPPVYRCLPTYSHHGHHHHHHGGYQPYNSYRVPAYPAPLVPYGAGYSGGYQPYQSFYYQQPRFSLQLGF
jgi:hypothetical protein